MCLWYRVREMLLCTVMCVWGTEWWKCYCVQWCVSEVQSEGNVIVYRDVCVRYRMREMWLCTVMCVWGTGFTLMCVWVTGWGKCYCVQRCVSEVQSEWIVTVYSDVCLRYSVRESLLCTVMCVWGSGWGKILLFTVMCVWYTGWGKCYCVQWCVSEVQGEGTITVYSDVCLR